MFIQIKLMFGGTLWAEVIDWGFDEVNGPYIVSTPYGIMIRNPDGYYYPI